MKKKAKLERKNAAARKKAAKIRAKLAAERKMKAEKKKKADAKKKKKTQKAQNRAKVNAARSQAIAKRIKKQRPAVAQPCQNQPKPYGAQVAPGQGAAVMAGMQQAGLNGQQGGVSSTLGGQPMCPCAATHGGLA